MRRDPVVISPYDPSWPQAFEMQRDRVEPILRRYLVRPLEHIGSTAIPGMPAKPIIDMVAVVSRIADVHDAVDPLRAVGWVDAPEPGDDEHSRHSFCMPTIANRTHHLHVIEESSDGWPGLLAFRDYLRVHPGLASGYAALKRELAAVHGADPNRRDPYRRGKSAFIQEVTALALARAPALARKSPPRRACHPDMMEVDHVAAARAVFDASAEAYVEFVGTELSAATESTVDGALLAAFAELVDRHPAGRVADIGCGPGRVAAFLASREIDVVGVDVSRAMLTVARKAHPDIEFREGRLTALPIPDHSLAGAVCWYSIIYTPPEHLDDVWVELMRVLAPHGHLLVAFQAGDGEGVHRPEAFGTRLPLTSYRHSSDQVVRCLTGARFHVRARAIRESEFAHESTPQAFILARTADRGSP